MLLKNNRLIIVVTIVLVTGFLVTSLASYFVSRSSLRSEITRNALPLTSDNIYSEIQRDLLRPVFISSLMANDTFLRDWVLHGEIDRSRITRYLGEIKNKYHTVSSFFVSDKTLRYYYPGGILKMMVPGSERDVWYYRVRSMDTDYEINVDHDLANRDTMTIFINYKVFDYGGRVIGATGVGLTVHAVKSLIDSYRKKFNRNIYFINKKGDITLHGAGISRNVDSIRKLEGLSEHSDNILLSDAGTYEYERNGKTYYLNTRYIREFKWYLMVEQSEDDVIRPILNALILNLVICVFIIGIVFMLLKPTVTSYQRRIEKLAVTDSLTGLHNRLAFTIIVGQMQKEVRRDTTDLSVIFMDIDNFKEINDSLGHAAGDDVLKRLAGITQKQLRESDVLCRWGGEEFVVILKECDIVCAWGTAEKIREKVADEDFFPGDRARRVTVSLGVAQYRPGEDMDDVMGRADSAMYSAKEKGRNRTEKET